jgi:adenylate cyclase
MISRLAFIWRSSTVRWVVGITLVMAAALIWRPLFTEFLELKFYDLKFRYRGPVAPPKEVVILAIDDDSLKTVGRWPWSREDISRLIATLKATGPRVIALDIIFAEKEETAAVRTLNNLRQEITQRGKASPEILALLAQEEQKADVDRRLVQVIGQGTPTILGFFFRGVGGTAGGLQPERLLGPSVIRASTYNLVRLLDTEPSRLPLMGAVDAEINLPEITTVAAGGGYFNMIPDRDGTIRWLPLTIIYGPDVFAPMSLVAMQHYKGKPPLGITLSRLGVEEIRLGPQTIPVDRYGRMLINYLGPPGAVRTYSAAAFMEGRLPPEAFKDKIVLVGATAVGIYDLRVTPFSGICPGVEVQATIIENLLHQRFITTPRYALFQALLTVLGLGLLMGLILPRLSAIQGFIFAMVLVEGFVAINYLLFSRLGLQLELFYPLAEIVLIYLGVTMQRFLAEERERERVKKAFESYVAPTVVQQMLKHPERLRLGGERREITVLFTDIRGFTTMSENLDPEALVSLLHDFLNPMSNIIINQQGTIDKYMGDAIMALFGAPLEQPDHARLACRAALEMVATLKELNEQWVKQGRPPLRVGVGVNTGPVAVGNMGSDRLFDYTAVGDNVNLGSRLEGLNKYYGTSIVISQATADLLDGGGHGEGQFILRELDLVKVKGKLKPLEIYELLGEGTADADLANFLELYHRARALFKERRWQESASAFAEVLKFRPEDIPSRNYLGLSEKYLLEPPGADWQPVRTMDEK